MALKMKFVVLTPFSTVAVFRIGRFLMHRIAIRSRTGSTPSGATTASRNIIDRDNTPSVDTTRKDYQVVDEHPEVIIIDRREQSL
jgi:hypothetical protein